MDGLTPKELVERHEEAEEWGGYFIINGLEKIIRMLIMPRRNYVNAISSYISLFFKFVFIFGKKMVASKYF